MLKKNDCVEIRIEDMSTKGDGIGKVEGYALFVKDTVIGDLVEAKVIKAKKNYGFGKLIRIMEPSEDRVMEKCPIAKQCGGCQLQALSYEQQLEFKRRKVENNLRRIGKLEGLQVEPVIGMKDPWYYRNKAQFPIGTDKNGNPIAGFYAGRTHHIVEVEDCCIGVPFQILIQSYT